MAELKSTLKIMTGAILIFLLLISGITFLTVAKIPTSIASENFEPMLQAKLNKLIIIFLNKIKEHWCNTK